MYTDEPFQIPSSVAERVLIGPGEMLRQARLEKKMTTDEVARSLRLTVSAIDRLENEQFDHWVPLTFARGYLRAYAKVVALDPDTIVARFNAMFQPASYEPVIVDRHADDLMLMGLSKQTLLIAAAVVLGVVCLYLLLR